ncbi:MAG: acyl-CoA thioesterase domain-containing protein [Pseudomonadota bacterium]
MTESDGDQPAPPAAAPEDESPLGRLLTRLRLTQDDPLRFQGGSGRGGVTENNRLFGGLVLGQAAMAAGRTVEHLHLHALQAQFLRPTAPEAPVHYDVEVTKDGRRFANRIVYARQDNKLMLTAQCGFTRMRATPATHQRPAPRVPLPDRQPNRDAARGRSNWHRAPIDIRLCDPLPDPAQRHLPATRFWMRPTALIPDMEPRLHEALLAYITDRTLLGTAFLPYLPDGPRGVSLDHALHLYQPVDCNQWLLYDSESPAAGSSRGLAHGYLYQQDGTLIGTVVQEGTLDLE